MHPATARFNRRAPCEPPVTRMRAEPLPDRARGERANFGTDWIAGVDNPCMRQIRRGFRERRGDDPGSPGEHPCCPPRDRVLLEQHHRDSLRKRRHHNGDRHVSTGANHDIGPHRAEQPAGGDGGPRQLRRRPRDAPRRADVDAADVERLETEPGRDHEPLRDAVPAADHGHLVVRPVASKRERDRQCRSQVTPSSPPGDQRAHDSSSLAVDPGRRC